MQTQVGFSGPERSRFVLLLGPSGVGKSALIENIETTDDRFLSVSPFTDRPKRDGDKKFSVAPAAFSLLERSGFFLSVNHLYGNRYGVPATGVEEIMRGGKIPILDYPIDRVADMQIFNTRLIRIYVAPPSLEELKTRLFADGRALNNDRYEKAIAELQELEARGFKHPSIDALVVNSDLGSTARRIISIVDGI